MHTHTHTHTHTAPTSGFFCSNRKDEGKNVMIKSRCAPPGTATWTYCTDVSGRQRRSRGHVNTHLLLILLLITELDGCWVPVRLACKRVCLIWLITLLVGTDGVGEWECIVQMGACECTTTPNDTHTHTCLHTHMCVWMCASMCMCVRRRGEERRDFEDLFTSKYIWECVCVC